MKYIRTKNGNVVKHPYPNAKVFTFRYEIEKEADTIEELCDKVIKIRTSKNGNQTHLFFDITDLPLLKKQFIKHKGDCPVYLAIWTDKGLIYVAKMKGILPNGEIDWELL